MEGRMLFSDGSHLKLPRKTIVLTKVEATQVVYSIEAKRGGTVGRGRKKSDCESFLRYVSGK